jgi:outer membrane protein assembly factor BamB
MLPILLLLAADWTQWGGPHANFHLNSTIAWPEGGPRKLWERPLGDGFSSILAKDGVLYTMYRRSNDEVVIALGAKDGKTIWEHVYPAPLPKNIVPEFGGPGPRATPLLIGGRLFTAGNTGKIHAFDPASGKVLWSVDLIQDYGTKIRNSGYSPSPLAWGDSLIIIAGAPGGAFLSLKQADGKLNWKQHDVLAGYASPMLVKFAGREHVIALMAEEVIGFEPSNGNILWRHPHLNSERVNASQPVWGEDGLLFLTSAYDGGCRALKLTAADQAIKVEEIWTHRLVRVHFSNAIRLGEVVYASSGDSGPTPLTAVNVKTGALLWRDRSFAKASLVSLGSGRLLVLDEEGTLALAAIKEKGVEVLARKTVLANPAWTPPTVEGKRIYVRDRKSIVALELD